MCYYRFKSRERSGDMKIERLYNELKEINHYIYSNPELGNQEFLACKRHVDFLKSYDFKVEEQFLNIETAFKAVYDSGKEGMTVAVMGEYDALPGIGHGCGHNMIGTLADGTGILLKSLVDKYGGKVIVLGTPAEETDGGKVDMADQGVFNEVDFAIMAHPSSKSFVSVESLAMEAIQFKFIGKPAHAASSPEQGINALDAVIQTFNSTNALREHVIDSTRIHGIITEGGVAANIVPELAVAQFYVRAPKKTYLKEVVEKVKNCARGAALATGATLEISNYEKSYDNFVINRSFNEILKNQMIKYGFRVEENTSLGSLDAGNVSHVCPTVHPMFSITEDYIPGHTREMAEATVTDYALDKMYKMMDCLVNTVEEIFKTPELLDSIKEDFSNEYK